LREEEARGPEGIGRTFIKPETHKFNTLAHVLVPGTKGL